MKALVILAEGFEEIEAVTIIDVLRRGEVEVITASLANRQVRGSHQLLLESDALLEELNPAEFDALILPGGPAAKTLREHPQALATIRGFSERGKLVAAICAGPTALEAAGALRGKRATAYPGNALPSAVFVEQPVVEDENVVTSRGPATSMAFALKLLERLAGTEVARSIADKLLYH
jgi:4-methyl-5(b-hydroxyethyl)-thiazole monophosphate biosynthesis